MQESHWKFSGSFLRHEELSATKSSSSAPGFQARFLVGLDKRFFPSGIETGHVVEVKGPENCGKTYLLAHLLTQFLLDYPQGKVVLIDTAQQFKIRIVVKILLRAITGENLEDSGKLSEILASCPVISGYLDRLLVVKCCDADELIATVGLGSDSVLHHMIQNDQDIALICCDTIDNFSFTNSLSKTEEFDILLKLVNCLGIKRIPVICTTVMDSDMYGKSARRNKKLPTNELKQPTPSNEGDTPKCDSVPEFRCNIIINPKYFTHDLAIVPASQARIREMKEKNSYKSGFHGIAYLRSKHKANMAGSVVNHRVKFSILSDILHVDED